MSDRIKYEWLQLFNYLAEARGRKRERAIHVWTLASISTLYHSEAKFATTGRFSKTERERAMRCLCESDGMVPTELFHLSRRSQEKPKPVELVPARSKVGHFWDSSWFRSTILPSSQGSTGATQSERARSEFVNASLFPGTGERENTKKGDGEKVVACLLSR